MVLKLQKASLPSTETGTLRVVVLELALLEQVLLTTVPKKFASGEFAVSQNFDASNGAAGVAATGATVGNVDEQNRINTRTDKIT